MVRRRGEKKVFKNHAVSMYRKGSDVNIVATTWLEEKVTKRLLTAK
jgi:hypothetical protein